MTVSVHNAVGILDICDFGAVGDTHERDPNPGTPCAAALQAAVRTFPPRSPDKNEWAGGEIYLPPAPGVTPLIFVGPQETGGNDGATGFIIEKLNISSLGRNTNRQDARFDLATPDRVTVAAVGDFAVNQVVRVGGAGERQYYYRTKVNTHQGTNIVDGAISDVYGAGIPGLQAGMWIMVPDAHEHPVKVSVSYSVVNGDGTPAIAKESFIGTGVQYCDDFYGRIMSIAGNVLVLDTYASGNVLRNGDHPNTEVNHASCGIYARVFGTIREVFAGHYDSRFDMEGCGVLLYGDHGSTPKSFVNGWRCEHLMTYGCQHGLKILGVDANAGTNAQSLHLGARSWTIIDYSFLGNVHINPQMQGETGIITQDNPPSRTIIVGAYNEIGTPSNFGVGTDWHGGTIAIDPGGVGAGSGTWNKLYVGRIDLPTVFQCQTMMQPAGATNTTGGITGYPNFLNFQMAGGSAGGLSLRKLDNVNSIALKATVADGGSGYIIGDILTVQGGTDTGTKARFKVTSVEAGAVTSVKLVEPGSYTVLPPSPALEGCPRIRHSNERFLLGFEEI